MWITTRHIRKTAPLINLIYVGLNTWARLSSKPQNHAQTVQALELSTRITMRRALIVVAAAAVVVLGVSVGRTMLATKDKRVSNYSPKMGKEKKIE